MKATPSSIHASLLIRFLTIEAGTCRLSFDYSVAVRQALTGAEHWCSKPQKHRSSRSDRDYVPILFSSVQAKALPKSCLPVFFITLFKLVYNLCAAQSHKLIGFLAVLYVGTSMDEWTRRAGILQPARDTPVALCRGYSIWCAVFVYEYWGWCARVDERDRGAAGTATADSVLDA